MVELDFSAPTPAAAAATAAATATGRQLAALPPALRLSDPVEYGTPAGDGASSSHTANPNRAARLRRGARPNVLLLNVDDTGWGDYGFNNPTVRDTPNLDALRSRGMRLTDMHAGASVCTPSRASLLTGRIGLRTGVTGNFMPFSLGGLPTSEVTLATMLKGAGYRTAMAGKWHLGHLRRFMPRAHGFDSFFGIPMSHDYGCTDHPGPDTNCRRWQAQTCGAPSSDADGPECPISRRNPWGSSVPLYADDAIVEQPVDHRTLHDRYAAFCLAFLRHAAAPSPAPHARLPFFLYVAFSHLHTPIVYDFAKFAHNASAASARGHYGNAVRELDSTVGALVGALEALALANSTLILFTGDNGGGDFQCEFGGDNSPYLGLWQRRHGGGSTGKTSTWEGGHREPGLAVWPGHIGAGTTSRALVSQLDFFPTLAALAAAPLPARRTYDGVDLAPVLFGNGGGGGSGGGRMAKLNRRVLIHPNSGEGPPGEIDTVRVGPYKAKWRSGGIVHGCKTLGGPAARRATPRQHSPPLLFDVESDPAEAEPLNTRRPAHAAVLRVLEHARAAAVRSVADDPHRSTVDWAENVNVRPCCDRKAHMCRCGGDGGGGGSAASLFA